MQVLRATELCSPTLGFRNSAPGKRRGKQDCVERSPIQFHQQGITLWSLLLAYSLTSDEFKIVR